jgi:hypothetical protein
MELLVIVAFISVVNDLNASNTSIPCFLRIALGLLFYASASQSFKTSLLIQPLRLEFDNDLSKQLHLRNCFMI